VAPGGMLTFLETTLQGKPPGSCTNPAANVRQQDEEKNPVPSIGGVEKGGRLARSCSPSSLLRGEDYLEGVSVGRIGKYLIGLLYLS
jgi:hypothetical protein